MKPTPPSPWFTYRRPRPAPSLRLFCLPYAGGTASIYRTWQADLPDTVEVVPVQPPGRENRFREPAFERLDPLAASLAEAMLPLLDLPYAIFGHSLGALVGFETALRLTEEHGKAPRHLLASGRLPPHCASDRDPIHHLPEDEIIEELRDLEGTPAAVLENRELMQLMLPLVRADFAVFETYEARERPALPCPITAFGGLRDEDVPAERLDGWQRYGDGTFALHTFAGGHFFLTEEDDRPKLLAQVAETLRPHL